MAVTQPGSRRSPDTGPDLYRWFMALSAAVGDAWPVMAMQPIVDTTDGSVTGYEALARFDPAMQARPDQWFAMADRLGFGPALEAAALRSSLARRDDLPDGCWLSVNVAPGHLAHPDVQAALDTDLDGVVIELTEHTAIDDYALVMEGIGPVRARGARVAVDDAGAGYAGLQWLLALRPEVVKADRLLTAGLDEDRTRYSLMGMLATVADSMDAWLLAEGIETEGELDALVRLGVPLAQGFLLGRPDTTTWPTPDVGVTVRISDRWAQREGSTVAGLLQRAVTWSDASDIAPSGLVVVVDGEGRPVGLFQDGPQAMARQSVTTVRADEELRTVARRAVARRRDLRWDPLVCVDANGRVRGLLRVELVVEALVDGTPAAEPGGPWVGDDGYEALQLW